MSGTAPNSGAVMFDRLRPEIEKAFRDCPAWGTVGFTVHFVDSEPSRIEYAASVARQIRPRADRGSR